MPHIYSHTLSLCPVCKSKIQARIIEKDNQVFIEKFCGEHGFSQTLISSDREWYELSRNYVKAGQIPLKFNKDEFNGCPESCGFCSEHQQHTCLPVIEINYSCDMTCPICLKGENPLQEMTAEEFTEIIDNLFATEGKVDVINISGGEPTLHSQIEHFFEIAVNKGVTQISLSTNGLELLRKKSLRDSLKKHGIIAALQFDGFRPSTYEKLRGENLINEKLELIKILEEEEINYSLVATIAKEINDDEVADIAEFFFRSKALTLMFQPIAFTGFAEQFDPVKYRLTIPDVVKEVEKSSFVKKGDFNPLPCSHYSCFALAYYLRLEDNKYFSLKEFLGDENYLELIANKTLPGLDKSGYSMMKQQLYEFWSAADANNLNERVLERIRAILLEMSCCGFSPKSALSIGVKNMKAIFIHHFMDVHNFDFSRLVKCCNPYPQKNNRLVPICSENVCSQSSFTR